jgi:hypothetical protein
MAIEQPPTPIIKEHRPARREDFRMTPQKATAIKEAREQAKKLAKEKWTRERWREETQHDRGMSYRASGATLGLALGAAAGMLVGKGFQGKKVAQRVHHPGSGEWASSGYTEKIYSYERKEAPVFGAAIGGVVGGVAGYYFGKKADKKYYILVPKDIRTKIVKSSTSSSCLMGFGIVGPLLGGLAGAMMPAPKTVREGQSEYDWGYFLGGYLAGSALGGIAGSGFNGRANRKKLWEESIIREGSQSLLDIEFIPLDPAALSLDCRSSPGGETFCEYRMDLLRVRF